MRFLAINANDAERYPADSLERDGAASCATSTGRCPYVHDETQDVARALGAERTPHVFVLDAEQRLAYRGAPDADHEDPEQGRRAGCAPRWTRSSPAREPERAETPARGCSVKWREA